MRDQLKAGLSGTANQPDNEEGPSVSEIAEKIKTLKAANNIEATPQRVRQKHSSAEEPVTARIRRRTEAVPATSLAIQHDDAVSPPGTPADHTGTAPNPSIESQMTYLERIALERQRKEQEPSLP